MTQPSVSKRIQDAIEKIKAKCSLKPRVGLILGSGLGSLADELTNAVTLPYSAIPHFHSTSVQGHSGQMVLGDLNGVPTICLVGRFHYYEGHSMADVVFPSRVLCALGIEHLILTNAAGGVNTRYRAGDLMLIEDHLNLMGANPLMGAHLPELGPRFPDLTEAYHQNSLKVFHAAAKTLDISLHQGVYAGLSGPAYETPAEIRMLRTLGADAVGMSTVPEAIAANHQGVRVSGVSCITNLAAGLSSHKLSHQEVLDISKLSASKMKILLHHAVPLLEKRENP